MASERPLVIRNKTFGGGISEYAGHGPFNPYPAQISAVFFLAVVGGWGVNLAPSEQAIGKVLFAVPAPSAPTTCPNLHTHPRIVEDDH